MEKLWVTGRAVSGLFLATVFCQTGLALFLTYLANSTNTRGLGIVAFLLSVAASFVAGLWCRRKLSPLLVIGIVLTALVVSFMAYLLIGCFGLGWTGLLKDRNG